MFKLLTKFFNGEPEFERIGDDEYDLFAFIFIIFTFCTEFDLESIEIESFLTLLMNTDFLLASSSIATHRVEKFKGDFFIKLYLPAIGDEFLGYTGLKGLFLGDPVGVLASRICDINRK